MSSLIPLDKGWLEVLQGHYTQASKGAALAPLDLVSKVKSHGEELLRQDYEHFEERQQKIKGSDHSWLKNVMTSGTLADKQAALVLRVQEAPIFETKAMEMLLGFVQKKNKRESMLAIDSLYEVFSTILPTRKLISLAYRPLEELQTKGYVPHESKKKAMNRCIAMWTFESRLKRHYGQFLEGLARLLTDTQPSIQAKALTVTYNLLAGFPEREQQLLTMLCSALGSVHKKIASRAVYYALLLLKQHPNMKLIVVKEVEQLLRKEHTKLRAQFYGLNLLSQIEFNKTTDQKVADYVIEVYFSFFQHQLKTNDTAHTKLLSSLLTGINRANPFRTRSEDGKGDAAFEKHVNSLFKIVHVGSFNCSVQALMLLHQLSATNPSVTDRFFKALYNSLVDPRMLASSKHMMYLSVISKALQNDSSNNRLKAFAKRLLQIALHVDPAFCCAILSTVAAVMKTKPSLKTMLLPEDNDDEESFKDVVDSDADADADADSGKEGGEHAKKQPQKQKSKDDGSSSSSSSSDESDSSDDSDSGDDSDAQEVAKSSTMKEKASSSASKKPQKQPWKIGEYDAMKLDPRFAHAETTALWEISALMKHNHPSVRAYVAALLDDPAAFKFSDDPFQDFSLMRFLDRFSYKNPKKKVQHGDSIMQPTKQSDKLTEQPVNSAAFLQQKEASVRVEELFLYRYLKEQKEASKKAKKNKKGSSADAATDTASPGENLDLDDDFNFAAALGKAIASKTSLPDDVGGDDDDDDDDSDADVSLREDGGNGSDGDFNYDDLDDADFMDGSDADNDDIDDAKLEQLLIQDAEKGDLSDDDDDDDDVADGDEGDDGDGSKGSGKKKSKKGSIFAAAEEFAELLDADDEAVNKHEQRHQRSLDVTQRGGRRGRGGRGGRGGKRRSNGSSGGSGRGPNSSGRPSRKRNKGSKKQGKKK